jgi:hypothetical protein
MLAMLFGTRTHPRIAEWEIVGEIIRSQEAAVVGARVRRRLDVVVSTVEARLRCSSLVQVTHSTEAELLEQLILSPLEAL